MVLLFLIMQTLFYSALFKEIENKIREYGYMALVCPTDEDAKTEREHIKKLINRQIDGIIFFTYYKCGRENYQFITELAQRIPCIFMDQVTDDLPVSQVITDGFSGVKNAVNYLFKKGHRRIGCIRGPSKFEVTIERLKGYKEALSDFGIPVQEEIIYEGDFHMESGFSAGKYFSGLTEKRPTAIVSVTDVMAIGLLKYFEFAALKVPEQIEVIGFDNISLCKLVTPPLTTIAQPIKELGIEALKLLINKIHNPKARDKKILLNGELIIRRSTDINQHGGFNLLAG